MRLSKAIELLDNPKRKPTLNAYCNDGMFPAFRHGHIWDIDDDFIYAAVDWRSHTYTINELIENKDEFKSLSAYDQKQCRRKLRNRLDHYIENGKYAQLYADKLVHEDKTQEVNIIIAEEIENYSNRAKMLPISVAAKQMGISTFQAKQNVQNGSLLAVRIKNDLYVANEEVQKYLHSKNDLVGIYDFTKEVIHEVKTVFDIDNGRDRAALFLHMRKSRLAEYFVNWDQAGLRTDRKNALYFPRFISDKVHDEIIVFLKQFGTTENKLHLLATDQYWKSHPRTYKALTDFSETKTPIGMTVLLESILETLDKEIMDCTDDEIKRFTDYVINAPTKIYKVYAAQFITFIHKHYDCAFNTFITINYQEKKKNTISTRPYSLHEYMAGAYMCFSDEFIEKHGLIQRALKNEKYALLWLNMIWQYVGAWRNSDFYRMKIIPLLEDDETVIQKIESGNYNQDADKISLLLQNEINNIDRKPHKTQDRQDREFLVVVFPETLRVIVGLVYSICVLHSDGNGFHVQRFEAKDYINFFGSEYEKIFGRHAFLNRRANKAYLDAIRDITEKDTGNRVLGHVVASYARAHASEQGKLSQTTYKYLQSRLDGFSVNEVLMMLWDTGVCSFVPYMLLEIVYGDNFAQLTVAEQNEIIKISKLTALQAENTTELMRKVFIHSQSVINRLFYGYNEFRSREIVAKNIINSIISREAIGKQLDVICLCAARKFPCAFPGRQECFGCQYAMYERGLFFFLIERLKQTYIQLKQAATEGEKRKIQGMIDEIYLPSVYQVLVIAKHNYGMDIEEYKTDIQKLISGGDQIAICDD